ncbi:MAG: CDP-glycerol glycerophosphotransferase family protein [Clostridia bacterium]|nr:CDP-glycerol glycerophosphotransferase family protein [Clostridia bacterium]
MNKIRTNIIRSGICVGKVLLNIVYFFMKMLPSNNKIVMLSRQSDGLNIDFNYIKEEILKRNKGIQMKILCKKLRKNPKERLKYVFYIFKCMYHVATAKVCILDGYSIPISILKHKKSLVTIQIWHASGAIKKFGYQSINKKEGRGEEISKIMQMHKNYTYVISPSIATSNFYKEAFRVDNSNIIINGLPRLDYILKDRENDEQLKSFFSEYTKYKHKKTILYIPTFRKNMEHSDTIERVINAIDFSKYNLIIKLHPLDKTKKFLDYTIKKKYNTYDLLRIADYIITDYSSVAFEASILNKPIYFYVYDIDEYKKARGLNVNLFKEMSNSTSKTIEKIITSIENGGYDFEQLEKFKEKYMGHDYYNNTEKLVDFIFKCLDKGVKDEKIKDNIYEVTKEELNV